MRIKTWDLVFASGLIFFGLAMIFLGFFQMRRVETKNFVLSALENNNAADGKTIEDFQKGSIEEQFIASQATLTAGDYKFAEELLTQIIIKTDTNRYWRARGFYNLGNMEISKAMVTQDQSAVKNAVFYYQESLRLDSGFRLAKYNLERLIQEEARDNKGDKDDQEGEDKSHDGEQDKKPKPEQREDREMGMPNMNPPQSGRR